MKKQYRLRKNRDFQFVYRKGKSVANPYMVLINAKSGNNSIRVGFSVSKKIGKSVVRNRVKRLMKENFRLMLGEVKTGYYYVFVARNRAAQASYWDIKKSMRYLLKKNGMLKDSENS